MNETLKPYLEKLLSSGAKTVEEAAKFIETQTPELASEIIRWGAISESAAPVILLVLMIICVIFHQLLRNVKWYISGSLNERNGNLPAWPLNFIIFIPLLIIFIVQMMDVLYPLVAPRLFILEKISSLIK
jgi:hypothetical protein